MSITLIAAMDRNRAIGVDNKMPWHLPAEMAFFKATTTGKTVLMGRKTYESLGRPLPNRKNVILTRQPNLVIEGCEVVHSVEETIQQFGNEELMVIGGAEIYSLFLPFADTLLVTDVEVEIESADAFFPTFSMIEWQLVESKFREKDEKNKFNFTWQHFKRNNEV
ncbi:dihydrofolate reductase [Paenibacillus sp. GSMTC-2017]|uniref:dihydrofolate reductase n=1 Tax=Paenibacillus sp. GSMTC-2017 TaxID=2794350 RepID=UPI0018DA18FA|nr:dihydrofolate reductase [Paenibacillus sp. GSMTC-2017]MBH5317743.1 dihydrofolate reductase [Paenibacillus sp. GSMTC-2017]